MAWRLVEPDPVVPVESRVRELELPRVETEEEEEERSRDVKDDEDTNVRWEDRPLLLAVAIVPVDFC